MMIPLKYAPGVCKVDSPYSAQMRFTDMDKARFEAGYPEGIWNFILSNNVGSTSSEGTDTNANYCARGAKVWRDNSGNIYVGHGTSTHLYYYPVTVVDPTNLQPIQGNTTATDITPLRGILSSTLSNPFDTTNGSATVNVNHTAHGLSTGDYVQLVAGSSVGGLTIAGIYHITVSGADDYTITASSNATSTVTGGGGTTSYTYYRVTLSNPFDTTNGSATVNVNHTAHGASAGDYVTISGASAVGGITISGEYKVQSVTNANKYVITHTSNASSTVTGGGGSPNFRYNIASGDGTGEDLRAWSLDNYGAQLLASPYNGTIYIWDPSVGGRAYPMYNAPTGIKGMFVTPERFVFALGNSSNGTQVKWPDQDDYTDWTPSDSNTANTRTLQDGAFLVGGISVRDGISLVFTNSAAYLFNYTGDDFVYASTLAGTKCGLPGPLAVTVMEGIAYWFSGQEFWAWNGAVQRLPADDIRDYVVSDFYTPEQRQCVVGSHVSKAEIWVHYPSSADIGAGGKNVNSRYVIFFPDQSCWANGTFSVTSWTDSELLPCPLFASWSASTNAFHSLDFGVGGFGFQNASSGTSYIKVSPADVSSGERNADVFSFLPDFQVLEGSGSNGMTLTVYTRNYPQDSESTAGTFTIPDTGTTVVQTRISGKLVNYKLESTGTAATTKWRLGLPRIDAQPGGGRR